MSEVILPSNKLIISKKYCCSGKDKKIPFSEFENEKLLKTEKFSKLLLYFETWRSLHFDSAETEYLHSKAFQVLIFHKL